LIYVSDDVLALQDIGFSVEFVESAESTRGSKISKMIPYQRYESHQVVFFENLKLKIIIGIISCN